MKKRLLILTIVFSFLLVIAPNNVLAANNKVFNQKKIVERQKFKLVKPTKAQVRAVGSETEYYKQLVLETLDDMYLSSNSGKYTKEIKNIINDYYDSLSNEINNVQDSSEIVATVVNFFGMDIPIFTDKYNQKLYTFDTLVHFDIDRVNSKTNFDEFKDDMINAVSYGFDCYSGKMTLYNDYYYSSIMGVKANSKSILEESTDWLSIAEALGIVRANVSEFEPLASFSENLDTDIYCENDYDDEDEDGFDYVDEEESDLIEKLGVKTAPSIYIGQDLYTKDEIKTIKEGFNIYLDNYVNRQLKVANYPVDDSINNLYNDSVKAINSSVNVDEIVSIYERTIEKLEKTTGVEYKDYNSAKYKRLAKELDALRDKYTDSKVYSENSIYNNEYYIDFATSLIDYDNIFKDVEVPSDIVDRLIEILDETPTYKEELKQLKADYIAELKTFKNNKKYNQSKVVAIVNEGIKKINAAKTIEDVWDLYDEYYDKAEATIYKFKITTSKVGKGTISKSATIKYGNSYTVKIKPTVGYKISAIYVDGKKVKLTEKYTFKNITKKHTIKVVFK